MGTGVSFPGVKAAGA